MGESTTSTVTATVKAARVKIDEQHYATEGSTRFQIIYVTMQSPKFTSVEGELTKAVR